MTFCVFRKSKKMHLFHNVEKMWKKTKTKQLEFSSRVVTPRIVMRYYVRNKACYQACKRQSNALDIHYTFHLFVHVTAGPKSFRLPSWVEHSRIQRKKKDQCGTFSQKAHRQPGEFWRAGSNQATLRISHSSRQSGSPATMWDSLWSAPTLGPKSIYRPAPSLLCHHPGSHLRAAASKAVLSTPQAMEAPQLGKNAGCSTGWKAWESAALLFHVNIPPPLPFPRSPAENPFLFLSVQTRTMNSSSPQECDKVPTKPTRKVMYGL